MSRFRKVSLGCKDVKLKHVQSLWRQVMLFLDSPTQTLNVSFRVKLQEGFSMVYASSGNMSVEMWDASGIARKGVAVSLTAGRGIVVWLL